VIPARYPTDDALMGIAIEEARAATTHDDVPVGALVVIDGHIVARRHNEREAAHDPTAHAEILALRDAAEATGSWRLEGATVVVTLEPCPMCAGALQQARVDRVVFGATDMKAGACGSLYNLGGDPRLNHEFEVAHGVRADECAALLTTFFAGRRENSSS
jgi:tRNA(adenine34) deaminase